MRNGMLFAVESRVPQGMSNVLLRPLLDPNGTPKPFKQSLDEIAVGALRHGAILARIACIFRVTEMLLVKLTGSAKGKVQEWHTFVSGMLAGYIVMGRDGSDFGLKKNVNMYIAIRTLWSVANYSARTKLLPWPQSESGRQFGWETFVTLTWGLVMWHWKHQVPLAKGEMPGAMARSMDYIYADGDVPGIKKWFTPSSYAAMVLALWQFLRTSGRI